MDADQIALMTKAVEIRAGQPDDLDGVAQFWHAAASAADDAPPEMPSVDDLRARIDVELTNAWALSVAAIGGSSSACSR